MKKLLALAALFSVALGCRTTTPPHRPPVEPGPPLERVAPTRTPTPSPGLIDPAWEKPTAAGEVFAGCPKDGDPSGDLETDHLKNRVDTPANPHTVTMGALLHLPMAKVPTRRSRWSAADHAAVAGFDGIPVTVEGFIVKVKPEGSEKTNCGSAQSDQIDWHIPVTAVAGQAENASVVMEITPRMRATHPGWTLSALAPFAGAATPVRFTGWIMFDPDHPPHLGKYRATLWEIHPVTRIEVQSHGGWRDLDSRP